jgi:hypothetical protein
VKSKPTFSDQAAAGDWMLAQVDDPCVDNHRFAFLDDSPAMVDYEDKRAGGCCGCFDAEVVVGGRLATIGCNYGH